MVDLNSLEKRASCRKVVRVRVSMARVITDGTDASLVVYKPRGAADRASSLTWPMVSNCTPRLAPFFIFYAPRSAPSDDEIARVSTSRAEGRARVLFHALPSRAESGCLNSLVRHAAYRALRLAWQVL